MCIKPHVIVVSDNTFTMAAKRKHATMNTKMQAILEVEKNVKSKSEIARDFGIPLSTLSTWLRKKEAIMGSGDKFAPACKRMRTSKHDELEAALLLWFKTARAAH